MSTLKKRGDGKHLRVTRRRLSVVSDNKLIEGFASVALEDPEEDTKITTKSVIKCFAGVSQKGYAPYNPWKKNQDSILMAEDKETNALAFAVLDGHGEAGDGVSKYFTDRLADRLFKHSKFAVNPAKAMQEETEKLETELLRDPRIDTEFSGTTSVMCTIMGKEITVANIGDSRIILGTLNEEGKMTVVPLSDDHKPDREDEKRRILAAGGRVFAVEYDDGIDGPARVWMKHLDIPGLAMSRSLGDTVAHTTGVISTPEITRHTFTPNDKFLVLASDGLWEFISNEEVSDVVRSMEDPKAAVDQLITEASARWMKEEQVVDDTTVIVAYLNVE
eukprot:TRINITY_DN23282_c3_g1_i1.p1 TRINITY_DN23282_c3_g1~~TRINITY_DN23282_c3_g1_i1.p1  ORF type:complete len:333 (+),score=109.84 TRINITY_DN23282_c3_g1_i1:56-1054(+)